MNKIISIYITKNSHNVHPCLKYYSFFLCPSLSFNLSSRPLVFPSTPPSVYLSVQYTCLSFLYQRKVSSYTFSIQFISILIFPPKKNKKTKQQQKTIHFVNKNNNKITCDKTSKYWKTGSDIPRTIFRSIYMYICMYIICDVHSTN